MDTAQPSLRIIIEKKRLKTAFQKLVNTAVMLLALIGLLYMGATLIGEHIVPAFKPLNPAQPALLKNRYLILSLNIQDSDSPQAHWQALQPSLALLHAINPDISRWITQLNAENRIIWKKQATLFNWPVLASYVWQSNDLYLGPGFWRLQEGEKAAALAHEYFHYRQNRLWMIADTFVEAVSGKLSEYGSRTEDEAHLYQWCAYRAMRMSPSDIVQGYFSRRKLYRFILTPPVPIE